MVAGKQRASMADVAQIAGVSHQTVSRVLNGSDKVRPETRDRVVAAMEQLSYRRNHAARALVTRRSRILGVIAFGTSFFGPASMQRGIEAAARSAGYFMTVTTLEEVTGDVIRESVRVLTELGPDGVIVIAPKSAAMKVLEEIPRDLPAVAVEGGEGTDRVPVVCIDQEQGARLATSHLLELGHHTVHHIAGPPQWLEAQGRARGWQATLAAAGAPVPDPLVGDWSPRSGYELGTQLASRDDLSALFVANDQMSLGVLQAFREHGIRVPEDVSVVGFDDVPEAAYYGPPLTTVAQDFRTVGTRSLEVLLRLVDGEDVEPRHVIPARLIIRASTAPAPDPDDAEGVRSR